MTSRWVDVKDRLPALDKDVLVYAPQGGSGRMRPAYLDAEKGEWHDASSRGIIERDDEPTHWIPLPGPPEREKEGKADKAYVMVDMPAECEDCELRGLNCEDDMPICLIEGGRIPYSGKAAWCPLMPLPEGMEEEARRR